jgi:hypothetical protein
MVDVGATASSIVAAQAVLRINLIPAVSIALSLAGHYSQ